MARVTAAPVRRKVRLRSARGTRKVALPRPDTARRRPRLSPRSLESLIKSAEDRAKRFRRRFRRGIPIVDRKRVDRSVHDLRTSARRLLAALEALAPFLDAKRFRRLSRRIDAVLDRSGGLRDLAVQLEMLPGVTTPSSEAALRRLKERLRDKHEREASRLHRRLRARDARRLRSDVRRVLRRARRARPRSPRTLLQPARERFARLRESRLAVNPADVKTVHRMRIELKTFRYLMEALGPVATGIGKEDLESLHALQTTMGDLHDLEVLSSTLARHVARKDPDAAADVAPVLESVEVRHSAMLTSFLEAVDPLLDAWTRLLDPRRRAAVRR
jgi:CHAD domain-containing protein